MFDITDIDLPAVTTEMTEEENTLNRSILENTTIVQVTKTKMIDMALSSFWGLKSSTYRTVTVKKININSINFLHVVYLSSKTNV